jgi:predicted lipid-binding transport protein (Tim44 family)
MSFVRLGSLVLALAATMVFMIDVADARVGRGGSSGSRGDRTFTAPPATQTAPKPAAPVDRTMAQPGTNTAAAPAARPAATSAAPSRFGGGFGGLLMGGLLGAGLFGLLSGAGLFGGLSGLASFLGLILQFALIAGVVYLVMSYFRSRNQPALARAASGPGQGSLRDRLSSYQQGGAGSAGLASAGALTIGQGDYDAFEKLLGDIQTAYAREDTDALGDMTTPEMLSYFSRDLADDKRQGVRHEVSDIKLLQGDLAEAWQEPGVDYATVAMRFSLVDVALDRTTGGVVSGNRQTPEEATEIWTFQRDHRSMAEGWKLSAIQQA